MKNLKSRVSGSFRAARRTLYVTYQALRGDYTRKRIELSWAGKPSRIDLINKVIETNGYANYLEIGCRDDSCFNAVRIANKTGVDPNSGGTHRMTSDEFFATNKDTFDVIFIDGLHTYEQVALDIANSTKVLIPGGTIVMHDCFPLSVLAQYPRQVASAWNGDVWKAFVQVRTMPNLDSCVCAIDHGVGVIKVRKNQAQLDFTRSNFKGLTYRELVQNYQNWMNVIEFADVAKFVSN